MKKLIRNPDIVWRVEKRRQEETLRALEQGEDVSERGTVILIISGMMHQLNLVGGMIWSLCDGSRDISALVAEMAREFEVEADILLRDVETFVDDLLKRGWLSHG